MSDTLVTREDTLPPDVALQVDACCERFEAAWKAGGRPRIEDYLGDVDEPGRAALVRELVLLDVEYLRRRGETPEPAEYEGRFPSLNRGWLGRVLAGRAELGRYRLVGTIGRGGMGEVLRATTRSWTATWPSRCCWSGTGASHPWCAASWGKRGSTPACSTPASCRSTRSASSTTATGRSPTSR
jgi:hypothetical protein